MSGAPKRSPEDQRRADLARIHCGKKALGLDDETYRAMLDQHGGSRSAADLSARGRKAVIAHLQAAGAFPRAAKRRPDEDPHVAKIRALWADLARCGKVRDGSEGALCKWIARHQGGPERLEWLGGPFAAQVVEALKKWLAR
ncbi:MAG: regulatory protein GemA [Rhodocyclaceae bacterium]|nr:regulatory protein GemA [Rhodocyclaceae bacterium]